MICLENVCALWFLPIDSTSDWLAAVCLEEGAYVIRWRVRYYRDKKLGKDSKDTKNWCEARSSKNESESIESIRQMLSVLSPMAKGECTEIIRGNHTVEWLAQELSRHEWCHMSRVEIKNEAD